MEVVRSRRVEALIEAARGAVCCEGREVGEVTEDEPAPGAEVAAIESKGNLGIFLMPSSSLGRTVS